METALSVTVLLMLCSRPGTVIESLLQSLALEYFSITQDQKAVILPDRDREDIGPPEDEHVTHSFIQKRDRKL